MWGTTMPHDRIKRHQELDRGKETSLPHVIQSLHVYVQKYRFSSDPSGIFSLKRKFLASAS